LFVQFGGALPMTPLTAPILYATPSGDPEAACDIATNTALAGKIALVDRGGVNCNDPAKVKAAQLAGAVGVLLTTPGDTGFPFRLGGNDPTITIPVLVLAENFGAGLLKSYLTNNVAVSATIRGDPNPRIAEWDTDKGFGAVNVFGGFAVPAAGIYPMRLVAGHMGASSGAAARANLEWFSVKADETKILVNDTSNPDSLRTFRARSNPPPVMNPPVFSGGNVTISWTGAGTLEESTAVSGPWGNSANQNNPQTVPATGARKFYRIRQ
jgi:hypothetical protein